jgi:hypothetical protein
LKDHVGEGVKVPLGVLVKVFVVEGDGLGVSEGVKVPLGVPEGVADNVGVLLKLMVGDFVSTGKPVSVGVDEVEFEGVTLQTQ